MPVSWSVSSEVDLPGLDVVYHYVQVFEFVMDRQHCIAVDQVPLQLRVFLVQYVCIELF